MSEERQRLLERWSAVEPERCWIVSGQLFTFGLRRGEKAYVVSSDWPQNSDTILGALIEAITARDGVWYLEGHRNTAQAIVFLTVGNPFEVEAESPADALLASYIQALEAKENS